MKEKNYFKKAFCMKTCSSPRRVDIFKEGKEYFYREIEDSRGRIEVIDEYGHLRQFNLAIFKKFFKVEETAEKNDEYKKIKLIFGNSWVELSELELKTRNDIKIRKRKETSPEMRKALREKLTICSELSEALNPNCWEALGAEEIGRRIRNFQDEFLVKGK